MKLAALLFSTVAFAGQLTIQTQEAVWTNGIDTITIAPVTVEGPGVVALAPYTINIADNPSGRTLAFGTQPAVIGDSETPFDLNFGGFLEVSGGQYTLVLALAETLAPNEAEPDFPVRISFTVGSGTGLLTGADGATLTGTLSGNIGIVTPEPSTYMLIGSGIALYGWRIRHTRKNTIA